MNCKLNIIIIIIIAHGKINDFKQLKFQVGGTNIISIHSTHYIIFSHPSKAEVNKYVTLVVTGLVSVYGLNILCTGY